VLSLFRHDTAELKVDFLFRDHSLLLTARGTKAHPHAPPPRFRQKVIAMDMAMSMAYFLTVNGIPYK
jgi:hypothetical protein